VVFLAGISMMWRGCGLLGDRKLASTLAVKALEQKSVTPLNSQSTPPGARNSNSQ
jgi:hypothetical protein